MPDDPYEETASNELAEGETVQAGTRPAGDKDLAAGDRVGRYELLEKLGAGGMGAVYRAHDPDLDREIAIKLLRAAEDGSQPSDELQQRLLREAQAMARLSHPNIVSVYDVGTFRGRVFIAMELVRGGTLRTFVAERKREWRDRLAAMLDAGRGLAEAHAAGVVHRDFKPDNVLISTSGRAQVGDFGLARGILELERTSAVDAPASGGQLSTPLTQTGAIMGTPAYMSPEQHRGEPADARSDQFSFAVTAYEALYGHRPFAGGDLPSLAEAVRSGTIALPPAESPVPPAMRAALVRALSADPNDRFPSLASLLDALERASAPRRRRWPLVASALALATVAGVGGGMFALSDDGATGGQGAKPATAQSEAPAEAGAASSTELAEAVERYRGDLQSCFEAEWKRDPLAAGTVVMSFDVDSQGRVRNVVALDRDRVGDSVISCIQNRMRRWRLPEPGADDAVSMQLPFAMVPPPSAGIVARADGSYDVDARVLQRLANDSDVIVTGGRVVPSIKDGKPNGFKLYAIQPGSLYEAIGLLNGDTVLGANGKPLATPDAVLSAYGEMKDADEIRLSVMRRGEAFEILYHLHR